MCDYLHSYQSLAKSNSETAAKKQKSKIGHSLPENCYKEEELLRRNINPNRTRKLGFVRVIDVKRTIDHNRLNQAVINHLTSDLKTDKKVVSRLVNTSSNLVFLTRVLVYPIVLVSLPNSPHVQLGLLCGAELSYFFFILSTYCRFKHLKLCYMFLSQQILSFFLLMFLGLCVKLTVSGYGRAPQTVDSRAISFNEQLFGISLIVLAVVTEYIFLLVRIVVKVYEKYRDYVQRKKNLGDKNEAKGHAKHNSDHKHRRNKDSNRRRSKLPEKEDKGDLSYKNNRAEKPVIFYHWVRSSNQHKSNKNQPGEGRGPEAMITSLMGSRALAKSQLRKDKQRKFQEGDSILNEKFPEEAPNRHNIQPKRQIFVTSSKRHKSRFKANNWPSKASEKQKKAHKSSKADKRVAIPIWELSDFERELDQKRMKPDQELPKVKKDFTTKRVVVGSLGLKRGPLKKSRLRHQSGQRSKRGGNRGSGVGPFFSKNSLNRRERKERDGRKKSLGRGKRV